LAVGLLHGHADIDMLNVIHDGLKLICQSAFFAVKLLQAIEVGGKLTAF